MGAQYTPRTPATINRDSPGAKLSRVGRKKFFPEKKTDPHSI